MDFLAFEKELTSFSDFLATLDVVTNSFLGGWNHLWNVFCLMVESFESVKYDWADGDVQQAGFCFDVIASQIEIVRNHERAFARFANCN